MRKFLSVVLSLMMVLSLLPAIAITSNAATTDTYTKVTEAQTDWSGDYIITGGNATVNTSMLVLGADGTQTGTSIGSAAAACYLSTITGASISDGVITGISDSYVYTIARIAGSTTNYSIKMKGAASDIYLAYPTSGNALTTADATTSTSAQWTISGYGDLGVTIANVAQPTRILRCNTSSKMFRCYTSQTGTVLTLFKLDAGTKFTLTYDANTTETVTGLPAAQTVSNGTVDLSTTLPARVGYNCLGWGATADATTAITQVTVADDNVTVYAIWEEIVGADTRELQAKIEEASELYLLTEVSTAGDGSDVDYKSYWVTQAAHDTFAEEIEFAELCLAETEQAIVDEGLANLTTAVDAFNAARSLGSNTDSIGTVADAKLLTTGTTTTLKGWLVYRYCGSSADNLSCAVIEDYSDNGAVNGIVIYNNALNEYNIGDYVYVTGTYSPYNGLPELTTITESAVIPAPAGQAAPSAQVYANWAAVEADAANIVAEYICISNVTLGTYSSSSTTHTDSADGTFVSYRGASYDGTLSENTSALAGSVVNLHGMFEINNAIYRIRVGAPKNYEAVAGMHTVTFVDGQGNILDVQSVAEGSDATPPEDPTREGHTFAGWDGTYTNITANTTITATWTVDTYALAINIEGRGAVQVKDEQGNLYTYVTPIPYGAVMTVIATPENPEHLTTVVVNGTVLPEGETFTVGVGAVTIDITFKAKTVYTVTLNKNGDESTVLTYNEGDPGLTLPTDVAPVGLYTFIGWSATVVPTGPARPTFVESPFVPTSDIKLFAVYAQTAEGGSAALNKMAAGDTLAAGDKIVVVAKGTTYGLYQETVNSSYVANFTFANDASTIVEKQYWTVSEVAGGGYTLGDSTNGYLYNSGNNLYAQNNNSVSWELIDNDDGTFRLVADNRYLSCRTDLTTANKNLWRMGGANLGGSGTIDLDIYKYVANASVTTYATSPSNITHAITLATGDGFELAAAPGYTLGVDDGNNFNFTLTVLAGYTQSTPVVTAAKTADGSAVDVTFADGVYSIENVTYDITISVSGIALNTYTLSLTVTGTEFGTAAVMRNGESLQNGAVITHNELLTISATPLDDTCLVETFTINGVGKTVTTDQTVSSDVAVAIAFRAKAQYTINFLNRGAAFDSPELVYEGGIATLPDAIDDVGNYVFVGWMIQDGELNDVTTAPVLYTGSFTPEESVTLVAVYVRTEIDESASGWEMSNTAPVAGNRYVVMGKVGETFYALPYSSTASESLAGTVVTVDSIDSTSNIVWRAVEGISLTEDTNTSSYLHLNNNAIRSTTGTTNGIFIFTASNDGYIMARNNSGTVDRWLGFAEGNFSVVSDLANAAPLCFMVYNDGTTSYYNTNPILPKTLTVTTRGMAARFDKTAVRFGASLDFAELQRLEVGDTLDYGYYFNVLLDGAAGGRWAQRSAAKTTVGSFTWTAAMDAATTPEELALAIRRDSQNLYIYDYDATSLTFCVVVTGLSGSMTYNGNSYIAADINWLYQPYATLNGTEFLGTIKYNSLNKVLDNQTSADFIA